MATKKRVDDGDDLGQGVEVAELSYSEAGQELDAIIGEFEAGAIDVDLLVERLQRATSIVDELDRRLRRTRMQVEELVPRLEAIGRSDVGTASDGGDGDLIVEMVVEDVAEGEGPTGLF